MAVLLLGAGCADVDLTESIANQALSGSTYYPVSDSQNPFGLEGEGEDFSPRLAVADFNNDGNPDIALENNYTAVMVRLGDGAGGFGAEARFNLAGGAMVRPGAVIAKDLDANGNVDIVAANDASLTVLMGNGNGTFQAPTSYAILPSYFGPSLASVTAADLNGDGKLDLAAGSEGGVGVLFGNGDGTFGARTDLVCGGNIHHNSVIAADFNGDGKLDLASAGSFTTSVYLFPGNGNGGFGACTATTVGSRPHSMTSGDFNQDGKLDLATANDWGINVNVLFNQGNGTFVTQSYPLAGREFDTVYIGTGYVDDDSSLDLLVSHQTSIFVMSGSPSGAFTTTGTIVMARPARQVVTGHFDHDPIARTDLLVSSDSGHVVLMRGDTDAAPCTSGCTPWIAGSTRADGASVANGANGGLIIAKPSAVKDGDVLYAFLTKHDDAGTIATPAGWTQLGQWATTAEDLTTGLWRKVVTSAGTEPASYRWTHSDNTAEAMSGYIVAVRGASITTPEDAPVAHASGINWPYPNAPFVTTTTPLALVLTHEGSTKQAMSKIVSPYDTTLVQSTRGTDRNSGVAAVLKVTPGVAAAGQWRNYGGVSASDWHTLTVAVRAR